MLSLRYNYKETYWICSLQIRTLICIFIIAISFGIHFISFATIFSFTLDEKWIYSTREACINIDRMYVYISLISEHSFSGAFSICTRSIVYKHFCENALIFHTFAYHKLTSLFVTLIWSPIFCGIRSEKCGQYCFSILITAQSVRSNFTPNIIRHIGWPLQTLGNMTTRVFHDGEICKKYIQLFPIRRLAHNTQRFFPSTHY